MITEAACHSTRALAELCRRKIMAKRYARHSSVEVVRHKNVVNSTVFLPAVIDTVVINIVPVLAESKPKVQSRNKPHHEAHQSVNRSAVFTCSPAENNLVTRLPSGCDISFSAKLVGS